MDAQRLDSPQTRRACPERRRRDGWTADRQLRFLDVLARTRSVTRAARAAGMSRESAYRLRARQAGGLFPALWDRALGAAGHPPLEGHAGELGDNGLIRLLGPHYRRKRGDYAASERAPGGTGKHDRTGPS